MKVRLRKVYKKIIAILTIPFILYGCTQTKDNKNATNHVHKYIGETDNGTISTYLNSNMKSILISDKNQMVNYNLTDEVIEVNQDNIGLYNIKGELFDVTQNKKYIENLIEQNQDYLEFHYHYKDTRAITTGGKFIQSYRIPAIHDGWTTDKSHEGLDGKVKLNHYMYYGYKITKQDGKWIKEKSPLVDDINEIIDEYPYFSTNCFELITKEYELQVEDIPSLEVDDLKELNNQDSNIK